MDKSSNRGIAKGTAAFSPTCGLGSPARAAGTCTLLQTLQLRQSRREFASRPLPEVLLLEMLWAGYGINRPESGKRTAPSARNQQEMDIYVAREDGLFLYNASAHGLTKLTDADLRADTGKQDYVAGAPVNLVYVSDFERMPEITAEKKLLFSGMCTGSISQNISLFCAANDLATVVRAYFDPELLAQKMNLRPGQHITLAQSIGFPAA